MLANALTRDTALLDANTLTWRPTGKNKFDVHDEEGWTLLPNKKVLTVDAYVFAYDPTGMGFELYNPASGKWTSPGGGTRVQLWDSAADCGGRRFASFEVGPAVLMNDGSVFATGANACGAAHTAIYKGSWKAGPDFPDDLGIADGPAALEPNGKVLMMASPFIFSFPSTFLEFDGTNLTTVPPAPNAENDSSLLRQHAGPSDRPDPFHRLLLRVRLQSDGNLQSCLGTTDSVCTCQSESRRRRILSPVTFSTACRKGLLTGTISNQQRIIRSSASPTTQLDTSSTAAPTTTAAWPSRSTVSYRLISMFQQPRNRVPANLLSSLMAFRRCRSPLRYSDNRHDVCLLSRFVLVVVLIRRCGEAISCLRASYSRRVSRRTTSENTQAFLTLITQPSVYRSAGAMFATCNAKHRAR